MAFVVYRCAESAGAAHLVAVRANAGSAAATWAEVARLVAITLTAIDGCVEHRIAHWTTVI